MKFAYCSILAAGLAAIALSTTGPSAAQTVKPTFIEKIFKNVPKICKGRVNLVYKSWPEFAPFQCGIPNSQNMSLHAPCSCVLISEFTGNRVIAPGTLEYNFK